MIFTVILETNPTTGNDLIFELKKAVENVRYNIGPEPIRYTTGPIYDGNGDGSKERIGTWAIDAGGLAESPIAGEPQFVAVVGSHAIMQGSRHVATATSHNMAKRIARALNLHKTNERGY